mgnify:CR=1 FL=1
MKSQQKQPGQKQNKHNDYPKKLEPPSKFKKPVGMVYLELRNRVIELAHEEQLYSKASLKYLQDSIFIFNPYTAMYDPIWTTLYIVTNI